MRYFIIILPAYYILLAVGVLSFRNLQRKSLFLFLIAILISQALWVYFHPDEFASWREIVAYVKKDIVTEDMLIFLPLKQIAPFMYYFSNNRDSLFKNIDIQGKKIDGKWFNIFKEGDFSYAGVKLGELPYKILESDIFKELMKKATRVFLVTSPDWPGVGQSIVIVRNHLSEQSWKKVEERIYPYPGVALFIYKK